MVCNMNDFYDGWPHGFIKKIEQARHLDEVSRTSPLYISNRARIYSTAITWLMTELENRQLFESGLDVERVVKSCLAGDTTVQCEGLRELAAEGCRKMRLAEDVFFFNWLNFVVRIAAGDEESAAHFFDNLVRQAVLVYRLMQQPRETGKMGGHPVNRHKEEALLLAKKYHADNPDVVKTRLVQLVISDLKVKYIDIPHSSTVRKWLTVFYKMN